MNKLISFIAKNRFIHNLSSFIVNRFPLFILHNFSKYFCVRKVLYSINIDDIEGDYCEFGCFTGACLNHALNTHKVYMKDREMKFYGFDSFEGFPVEVHKEFKSENFQNNFEMVKKLEKKFINCKIVKGFFEDTLKDQEINNSITKISFAFIDCDLAISAKSVFKFIKPRMSHGSFIMIDDYFNIDKNGESIFSVIKDFFVIDKDIFVHSYFGNSGIVFKYFKK